MLTVETERVYNIIGVCQRREEIIDTAQDEEEANYLVEEYKLAFGKGWKIFKRIQR